MITANNTTYNDDFNALNEAGETVETKNYLRILFNGGRSVQIRELNQLQSILQSQIDKFGTSVYKPGSAVIGGNCTFDRKVHAITFTTAAISAVIPADIGQLVQVNLKADVIDYAVDETTTTFYVRYSTGDSTDNTAGLFDIAEAIGLESTVPGGASPTALSLSHTVMSAAFLSEGVFFINGSFVITPKQNLFIDIPVGGVTGKIVLEVAENYVTYIEDNSLLDNADGEPNHLAPGADRYQIELTLAFLDEDAAADEVDRVTLLDISNGNVVINSKNKYSDLDRQLAQRTFEESGNYVVNPFPIEVANLYLSSRPIGDVTPGEESEHVYVGLDPSVAYVDGYRIELSDKYNLTAPRATTTEAKVVNTSLNFGNYINVSAAAGSSLPLPNAADLTYELLDTSAVAPVAASTMVAGKAYKIVTVGTTTNFVAVGAPSATVGVYFVASGAGDGDGTVILTEAAASIGTVRIKSIESIGANYRLFLYDVALSGSFNVADVTDIINEANDVYVQAESVLQDTANDTGVFKLPYENIESLASEIVYVKKRLWESTATVNGEIAIGVSTNESFGDASISNFLVEVNGVWLENNGTAFDVDSSGATSITLLIPGLLIGDSVKIIFPVTTTITAHGVKELTTITEGDVTPLEPSGDRYTLANTDIFDILSVTDTDTTGDVTADFIISFDGQRPSKYTNGELQYVGSGTAPNIEVQYRFFDHTSAPPYTVNSYTINWTTDPSTPSEILYSELPVFDGVSLGDCVDFRPTILDTDSGLDVIQPDPNSIMTSTPTMFLPRTDKVIVNANGEFEIIGGTPNLNPRAPATPPSSMVLYELQFPAYTFDASDVVIKYVDNRRYTMRDIGKLDKRINTLEYYTSLSLIEASVAEKSIFDSVQGSRFKNGILVDAFGGHSVGDVFNTAYRCSIDKVEGVLRPYFSTDSVDLVLNPGTSDTGLYSRNENTITLAFEQTPIVSQLKSSETESVNPYDVATFVGALKLYPTNDQWFETNRRPDIIINDEGAADALKFIVEESGILGTEWNSWETVWTGTVRERVKRRRRGSRGTSTQRGTKITRTSLQNRTGTATTFTTSTTQKNLGDRIIDMSIVPFIRSRRVYFKAEGLKPLTKVYPYFDGIAIADYCMSEAAIVYPTDLTSVTEYFDQVLSIGTDLISDDEGSVIGSFVVPNNTALKFRTGERVFRLTDSSTNDKESETTFAEGVYNAAGTSQTVEATILSTRVPEIKQDWVVDSRLVVDTKVRYKDPLAQTFVINDIQEGIFATSIDLYFTQTSVSKLPVSVRIVATENGYPTQRVLPFSETSVSYDLVVTDGVTPTNFAFSDPVYLKSGVEYAIVILSNDPEYRIQVARLGGTDADGKIIQSNPYGGVMFMSQNASTWTADQTRDIKFVINRAVFTPDVPVSVEFKTIMRDGVTSAPTSAFRLIQNQAIPQGSYVDNELTFGASTYTDIDKEDLYSPASEFVVTSVNRATIASELSTDSEYITPVIDLDTMALLCIKNEINNLTTDEDTADAGSALSRYFTREVELNDPADQLNIYLDINRPNEDADVVAYVKLKYDSETYSDWTQIEPLVNIPVSDNPELYEEVSYVVDSSANDFISFSLKLVFTSASTVSVPTVKNLRIIATS